MVARMRILFFHPEMFATLLVLSHLALISRAFRIPCTFLPGHGDILRASSQQGGLHSCVVPASRHKVWRSLRMSESTDDYPSDSGDSRFDAAVETKRMRGTFSSTESPGIARPKMDLLRLSAITGRGQFATQSERSRIDDAILELEMSTPIEATATDAALEGRWALVYASEDATRSSPFFWAFRKATEQLKVPFGGGEEGGSVAARIFAITDSIPGKSVGEAVQTITAEQIRSEVEIYAGASAGSDAKNNGQGPASFPSFRSVMTTTSDIISTSGMETTLRVAKTQVRKSALGRLLKPIFNLDEVEFPTERLLSPLRQGADEVVMKTTFLDENLRISRNEQGQVFVFVREDDGELR